jgi:hypothetical protein
MRIGETKLLPHTQALTLTQQKSLQANAQLIAQLRNSARHPASGPISC